MREEEELSPFKYLFRKKKQDVKIIYDNRSIRIPKDKKKDIEKMFAEAVGIDINRIKKLKHIYIIK